MKNLEIYLNNKRICTMWIEKKIVEEQIEEIEEFFKKLAKEHKKPRKLK